MYLPKSKYTVDSAGANSFILADTGEPYIGPVLTDYRGNFYAGSDPYNIKGQLEVVLSGEDYTTPNFAMNPGRRIPTEEEYASGKMERYFQQDLRTMKIIEILPKRWVELQSEQLPNYYKVQSCLWLLVGRIEDYKVSGHLIEGIRTRNQRTVDQMEIEMPGITSSSVLDDPLEFVRESA